ncbi:mitochondrial carrier domain-containing protein [Pavlovales sp. CCMP2436]|nr:mitochondrial carrier domain-containing protein [Pavlovales sp. CCMP2436]
MGSAQPNDAQPRRSEATVDSAPPGGAEDFDGRLLERLDDWVIEPLLRTHGRRVLLAGGVAGLVSRTFVAPLERTKLLFQVQSLSVSPPGQPMRYTSVTQSISAIFEKEGLRGLFKGNGANCVRIIPMSGLQFYAYDVLKCEIYARQGSETLTPLQRLGAGAMAGAFAQTLTYPLDFMRARLTVDMHGRYSGIFTGMWAVARAEGVGALYRGLFPSLVGIMPYVGVDFMVYGTLREMLPVNPVTGEPDTVPKLIVGAVAGAAGQTVAYPLDTIRRQLQVQDVKVKYPDVPKYEGLVDCFRGIVRRDGVRGLYRGIWPNYLKVAPSISIQFVIFEKACDTFARTSKVVEQRQRLRMV